MEQVIYSIDSIYYLFTFDCWYFAIAVCVDLVHATNLTIYLLIAEITRTSIGGVRRYIEVEHELWDERDFFRDFK